MEPTTLALIAGFVFAGFTVQTMVGFGGNVITLALGALVAPIELLVPLIVCMSLLNTSAVLIRNYREVLVGLLVKRVLPLMVLGAVGGQAVIRYLQGPALELGYGAMVVVISARELWLARPGVAAPSEPLGPVGGGAGILGAGVIHGIYASGGPLLVYVLGREGLPKGPFRSTLISVFWTMNLALALTFVAQGRLTPSHLGQVAWLVPGVALGLFVGQWGHDRVDEERFRLLVNTLLVLVGSSLVVASARKLLAA